MLDLRMRDLVTYAKNVERRIYDTANSKVSINSRLINV